MSDLTDVQLDYIKSGSDDCSCTDCQESHRLGKMAALELVELRKPCKWTWKEEHGYWLTGCGKIHSDREAHGECCYRCGRRLEAQ